MKKIFITIYMIFALILVPLYFTCKYIKTSKPIYSYSYKDNSIDFYKNNKLLNSYKCKNDCHIHTIDTINYFNNKTGEIIVKDGSYLIMYNIFNDKIKNKTKYIKKNYNYIKPYKDYLLVKENNNLKVINYMEEDIYKVGKINEDILNVKKVGKNLQIETEKEKFIIKIN